MNMFKTTALGSLFILGLSGAAACSGDDDTNGDTSTTTTTTTTGTGGAGGGACPAIPKDPAHPSFGYDPANTMDGPDAWGTIKNGDGEPAYPVCGDVTVQQAPVAFPSITAPWAVGGLKLDAMTLNWSKAAVVTDVMNKGYTWQASFAASPASTVMYKDEAYTLAQFHFHSPSEHTVDGKSYPLEVHFVHVGGKGAFGVAVGVFFEEAATDNPELAKIWDNFNVCPQETADALPAGTTLDITALFPKDASHYEYDGGLTAPPCTQTVHFYIMTTPIKASKAQINALVDSLGPTNRPVQDVLDEKTVTFLDQK